MHLISNSHLPVLFSTKNFVKIKLWKERSFSFLIKMICNYAWNLAFSFFFLLHAVCRALWNKIKYGVPRLLQKNFLQNCLNPICYVSSPAARISTHTVNLSGSLISFGCLNCFETVSSKHKICYCIVYVSAIVMFL